MTTWTIESQLALSLFAWKKRRCRVLYHVTFLWRRSHALPTDKAFNAGHSLSSKHSSLDHGRSLNSILGEFCIRPSATYVTLAIHGRTWGAWRANGRFRRVRGYPTEQKHILLLLTCLCVKDRKESNNFLIFKKVEVSSGGHFSNLEWTSPLCSWHIDL